MAVSKAPLKLIILAKIKTLLKIITEEKKSKRWQLVRLRRNKPMPKQIDMPDVANTNIRNSKGLVDCPNIKLIATAIKVMLPVKISIAANTNIPACHFFIF